MQVTRLPTVTDVAAAAGVSRQTVSNVLNTPEVVREGTRVKVQAVIDALGYRPHASARRLRTQQSSTLGVRLDPVIDGISGALLDRFLHSLTAQAERHGLRVLLYTAADADAEVAQFRRLLDAADVDAFVLTSTVHADRRVAWLVEHGVRFVTFGRPWGAQDMSAPQHLWVDVDGRSGVADATRHLLARGHRRIAFLGWPAGSGTGDDRRRGWAQAMAEAGASTDGLDIAADESVPAGTAAVAALRERGGVPDAVVAASDSLALGARLALGAAVPVVGFDDTPVARALGFSSVAQPIEEVAAGVLDLLTGVHGGRPGGASGVRDPQHRLVRPQLAVR